MLFFLDITIQADTAEIMAIFFFFNLNVSLTPPWAFLVLLNLNSRKGIAFPQCDVLSFLNYE